MKASETTGREIMKVMKTAVKAHSEQNLDLLLACFDSGEDVTIIGTSDGERWRGLTRIRKALSPMVQLPGSRAQAYRMKISKVDVSAEGRVAWLAADCEHSITVNRATKTSKARLTVVFRKTRDGWRICQWHKSKAVKDKDTYRAKQTRS